MKTLQTNNLASRGEHCANKPAKGEIVQLSFGRSNAWRTRLWKGEFQIPGRNDLPAPGRLCRRRAAGSASTNPRTPRHPFTHLPRAPQAGDQTPPGALGLGSRRSHRARGAGHTEPRARLKARSPAGVPEPRGRAVPPPHPGTPAGLSATTTGCAPRFQKLNENKHRGALHTAPSLPTLCPVSPLFFCRLSRPARHSPCGAAQRGEARTPRRVCEAAAPSPGSCFHFRLPPLLPWPGPAQPCPAAAGRGCGAARVPCVAWFGLFLAGKRSLSPRFDSGTRSCGRTCEAQGRAGRGRSPCARPEGKGCGAGQRWGKLREQPEAGRETLRKRGSLVDLARSSLRNDRDVLAP